MKITMNEKRTAVIETLKNATAPMTLTEIANAAGVEVKSVRCPCLVIASSLIL